MPEKNDVHPRRGKRLQRVFNADHVSVFIIGRAVHELDSRQIRNRNGSLRKRAQPFKVIAGQLVAVPERGQAGYRIKTLDRINPSHYFVVVAADESSAKLPHARRDFIWTGVVSDDIAQVDHNVCRWRDGQARLQCFQIAVDVTQEKYAQ